MGELALRPWEFWELTPAELSVMLDGYNRRERRAWERTAWLAANIMNVWTKRRLKISDIAPWLAKGERRPGEPPPMSKAELEAMARANKAKFWTKINDKFRPDKAE
jgi:hypothetical protein